MPKVQTKTSKLSKLKNFSWNKFYGPKLTIIGLIIVATIAGSIGVYTERQSSALTRNDVWRFVVYVNGCPTNAYGIPPTIRRGSTGGCVKVAQFFLNEFAPPVGIDGQFGPGTENKVKAFQYYFLVKGLPRMTVDGIIGPQTWTLMYNCINADNAFRTGTWSYQCKL